ncbi:MAG: MBL fold metallo-hydrolase [Oligoflexia bacterium]|nr:MBL fold metallo-hydrolase [Oligoflexia bacterium]
MTKKVETFYDPATFTLTYIVFDEQTKDAIVIDPVMDYNPKTEETTNDSVEKLAKFIDDNGLKLSNILETHAHADHLTGAKTLKKLYPEAKVAIGENITKVQEVFKEKLEMDMTTNGEQFDILLNESETLSAGSIEVKTIFTPGHTPACSSYLIDDMIFTGDALFMPDFGTGRCDFPSGSSKDLYHSIHDKLYSLPDETRVFTGHDYQPGGRELKWESTIGENKAKNIQLKIETSEQDFVKMRDGRDANLMEPKLLLPSIKANIVGGKES